MRIEEIISQQVFAALAEPVSGGVVLPDRASNVDVTGVSDEQSK